MTYHTDNKVKKYVQGSSFLSFAKNFGSKYGKKIIKELLLQKNLTEVNMEKH